MRVFFIVLFVVFSNCLPAISIDSLQRQRLIREGQSELCQLIGENESVSPASVDQMRFVVVIDGNTPEANYVTQTHIDSASVPILESATIDSINKYLRDTYTQYHIEMYMIIIKSLDVVVKTPLPVNPTARQLFTQKLYDEQTNIAAVRAEHLSITNAIINSTFSARNRTCLIYSRAMYKGVVVASGKMSTWNFSKTLTHTASPNTYNYTVDLQDYFFSRIENNTEVTQAGTEYSLRAVAREFYLSAKFISLKSAILATYTPSAMSAIFDLFEGEIDYENLTEPERIHALGVFAGYTMQGNMLGNEEFIAIDIVKYTPADQVATLLYDLASLSPLETNSSYHGEKNNEALIVMLINEIDDGIVGNETDAYTEFIRAITILQLSNENVVSTYLPETDQQWLDRSIYWDDTHWITTAPIGCHDYTITLLNNGKVKVEKEVVDHHEEHIQGQTASTYYTAHWDDTYAPVEMNPFAIVAFTNRSDYAMLEIAGAAKDEILLAPAIFLKYAEDKESNANAIEATAIAVDIVALVTGPGIIISAIQAGRKAVAVYETLQFLGSALNLYANTSLSAEFDEAVQLYNVIVGTWGLSRIATSGAKYTVDYISSVRNGDVQAVSTAAAQSYIHKFDQITNWNGTSESVKTQMRRMRELLGKNVAASAVMVSTQFSRAVINGLTGFVNRITSLAAQYSLSLTEFIALEGKSAAAMSPAELATMNAMRNAIPHPNATTIMQKAIPKSDIGKYLDGSYTSCRGFMSTAEDSKHLETFEDIYYGMRLDYTNTAFNLSDGSCGVIRFKAANSASVTIPKSVANQGTITSDMPFTGHGFTSGSNGRLGVPEWKMDNFAVLENGAELWEVFSDGSEVLRGRYDKRILKFVAVN